MPAMGSSLKYGRSLACPYSQEQRFWIALQERDDLRKRTRQERLDAMRFGTFTSQLERERHALAVQ